MTASPVCKSSSMLEGRSCRRQWKTPKCGIPTRKDNSPFPTSLKTQNRFMLLENEEPIEIDASNITPCPNPPKKLKNSKNKMKEVKDLNIAQVDEQTAQPLENSYFLPGKIGRQAVRALLDTGCTTNILAKHVFDKLPASVKNASQMPDMNGVMADGTPLPLYGLVSTPIHLRDLQIEETFVVSRIREDVILGMPFFVKNRCALEFIESTLRIGNRSLACTDRFGQPLSSNVQSLRQLTLRSSRKMNVVNREAISDYSREAIVERVKGPLSMASAQNCPTGNGQLLSARVNPAVVSNRMVITKPSAGFRRSGPVYSQYRRRNEGCNRHRKELFSRLHAERTSTKAI